jgi:gas vesicle protein
VSVQNTLITGGVVGAAMGVAFSYLFFTEQGRVWRADAEANLDTLAREAEKLLTAVDQVRHGVAELRGTTGQAEWSRTA